MLSNLLPSRRGGYFLIFLACAGGMAFALYAQYVMGLQPCPLCVFQRVAIILTGLLALLVALVNPQGCVSRGLFGGLVTLAALGGAGVAGWQTRLQLLPADQVPACGPGLDYMLETMPLSRMLAKVFHGSGECAAIDWTLLGLSMPMWSLVFFIGVIVFSLWLLARRR